MNGASSLNGAEQAQLGQSGNSVIEAALLEDPAILNLEDCGSREAHLPARTGGQATNQEVVESGACVGSAALPLADDIVAFSDEVRRAPEVEVRKGRTEIGHESLNVRAAFPRLMQ